MAKIEPENVPKCGTFRGTLLLNHPINFADAMEVGNLSNRKIEDVPNDGQFSAEPGLKRKAAYAKH